MELDKIFEYLKERDRRQELESCLVKRNLNDLCNANFALYQNSNRLYFEDGSFTKIKPFVLIVAIPTPPFNTLFSLSDDKIWSWLDTEKRKYEPCPTIPFLPCPPKAMADGILMAIEKNHNQEILQKYLAIERNGVIELGLSTSVFRILNNGVGMFGLTSIVGHAWLMLNFVKDLYEHLFYTQSFSFLVNLRGTKDTLLGGFARGWLEPTDPTTENRIKCKEPAVQIRRDSVLPSISCEESSVLIREIAVDIEAAWEHECHKKPPRCYAQNNDNKYGIFDSDRFYHFALY